jgi:CHASE2 domain-containing sensor protein/serine/threonine protein kinase
MAESLFKGRYRWLRVLGSGGFGQTYLVEDTQHPDAPDCVIKHFKPVSQDGAFLEVARRLFFNEAEVLKKVGTHDRIPSLIDQFEEDGQFYLVQQYIEGRALHDELAIHHKLSEPQVIDLLRDVLEILEFVHANHVIHRDIKPSNLIRRQQDGRLVLIDFGAVKELQTQLVQDPGNTKLTVGIATEGYGPSEQLAGKPRLNSDIYALGMTAIQALTGLHPSQLPSHPASGEVVWRDRAQVSPWLAAILTNMVRYHFNQRYAAAADVLAALEQTALAVPTNLQALASHNLETQMPLSGLGNMPTLLTGTEALPKQPVRSAQTPLWRAIAIACASLLATGVVEGLRQMGAMQPLELAAYDRLVQTHSNQSPDPRLLVVGITEADIQQQKRFPLADQTLADTIRQLQRYQPRAIGLDIYRDIPQAPGNAALLAELKAPNVVGITNLADPIVPAPPGMPSDRVGFNDVVLDADGVVRRNLWITDYAGADYYSFSLRLALLYLAKDGITLQSSPRDRTLAQLGKTELHPLDRQAGGYHNLDDRGYQLLLTYRHVPIAQQVSLGDVLAGKLKPEQVKDKIVLIGTTAANAKDLFLTPDSPLQQTTPRTPGVLIHAHMLNQFLTAATTGNATLWYWSDWQETLWIGGWAIVGSLVGWQILRRPDLTLLACVGLAAGAVAITVVCFQHQGWIPIAAPIASLGIASTVVIVYRLSNAAKRES